MIRKEGEKMVIRKLRKRKFLQNPPKTLAAAFFAMILLGSFLLVLPFSSAHGVSYIDALFTATSAVCVTGLTTVTTATTWTPIGKGIILALIQIGGWGVMTMATMISMFLGHHIGLSSRRILQSTFNEPALKGMVRMLRYILFSSLLIESIGAFLLSWVLIPQYGIERGIAYSIFHSISSYCNAGFDLFGDSLYPFRDNPWVLLVISMLIILGGIGFSVYYAVRMRITKKKRLTLHAKLVLLVTGSLLLIGTVLFYFLERNNPMTLGSMSTGEKWLNAFFQSVTTRTAGYYAIRQSALRETSALVSMLLMFIGGSPASTAGGIKTTTFVLLVMTMWSELRGRADVNIFRRRIPTPLIRQALSIIIIALIWIFFATFLLMILYQADSITAFFEVFSAFGTVGLTRGLTEKFELFGKCLIILTMYLGRIGPLTMGYAFAKKKLSPPYREVEEQILIG